MDQKELERRFTYHHPKTNQVDRYERIRDIARRFAEEVLNMCPDSRESRLSITHIEEAVFWANAAIARHE